MTYLQQFYPSPRTTIALLEQAPDADKTSLLVKARLALTAASSAVAPSSLQGRVEKGRPLPRVELMLVPDGGHSDEDEGSHKMRTFLLGLGAGPRAVGCRGTCSGWC